MPKVVHVVSTPEGIGGAEQMMLAIAGGAAARGWEAVILNPFARDGQPELARRCEGLSIETFPVRSWRELPRMRRWLADRLTSLAPEMVHAHLFHALVSVASLKRTHAWKSVLSHQHGDRMRSQGRLLDERLDRWGGPRFERVVACSEWVHRFLVDQYRYPSEKVITIPNGWTGRPRENIPDSRPTVVCVANFRLPKGHRILIDAFSRVVADVSGARLLLIGSGPEEGNVRAAVQRRMLQGSVEFVGGVDDVWPYLSRAHVAVLPSLSETFGIAALEAMAAGLPVIASRVGGIPEVVVSGETGLLVPPGDPVRLAQALTRLLTSPETGRGLGDKGRAKAQTMRMDAAVDRYLDLYEALVG